MAKFRQTGFAKVRRGLLEHLQEEKINATEFTIYMLILLNADPETGVWNGSSGLLASYFHLSPRTCRENLEKLEKKGYVKRFPKPGKHGSYPILIDRYEITAGRHEGRRVNAKESLSSELIVTADCEEYGKESAGKYLEKERKREKKPLREKRAVDLRHTIFRDFLERCWRYSNAGTTLPELPWDGRTAKALDDLLSASPTLDAGAFSKMLNNRRMSDVNQAEHPAVWLRRATDYAAGPLDRYGKPKGASNGASGANSANKAQQRTDSNVENARRAAASLHRAAAGLCGGSTGHSQPADPGTLRDNPGAL